MLGKQQLKVVALTVLVGALPFLFSPAASAQETNANGANPECSEAPNANGANPECSEAPNANAWLDDPHEKIGFTYGAQATLQANYIWRGMYVGGLSLQGSADVGYGGLYADMWWNLGTTDYAFSAFQPEVDLTFGFARWGLDLSVMYVYNFNRPFFDFANYAPGMPGNGLEVRGRYTVSSRLPLSFFWATRVSARDGYLDANGDLQRAYSTYIELSYDHAFPSGVHLYGALGVTPWRSMYTGYKGGATVCNVELRCFRSWQVSEHCGLRLTGQLMVQPYYVAHKAESQALYDHRQLGAPALNANIGFGVYLIK